MPTKLGAQPQILGWMRPSNKKFRKNFPKVIKKLPLHSFLDQKSFQIDGYFVGPNTGSVVLKARDKKGIYIVKSTIDPQTIITEAAFLKKWQKTGANVIKVLELIKPKKNFPAAAAILEYIPESTTEEELLKSKNKKYLLPAYKKLGSGLAIMHKAKGRGFGKIAKLNNFSGEHKTFGQETKWLLNTKRQKTLVGSKLLKKEELPLILKAIKIVEKDIARGTKPSLTHNDAGLFNTFGVSRLKFFDPLPRVSHPLKDLAMAVIWAAYDNNDKQRQQAVLAGYRSKNKYNELVFQACLFLKILEKWEWWLYRGKSEKIALDWIIRTKKIFEDAKIALEKS